MRLGRLLPSFIKKPVHGISRRYVLPVALRGAGRDSLDLIHRKIGIGNYETDEISGERFLVQSILPVLINSPAPILFDVGAHSGKYSSALQSAFPQARVIAFEPMPKPFALLRKTLGNTNVECHSLALSDQDGRASIFDYSLGQGSEHASLYSTVLKDLHHADSIQEIPVTLRTLDSFCIENRVATIDFLKIDTEGNELKVLQGGKSLIDRGAIRSIQFEFNEMNVVSRVFLRDFYDLLGGFDFYRLLPHSLLHLGAYSPRNEIFAFQNILAVNRSLVQQSSIARYIA